MDFSRKGVEVLYMDDTAGVIKGGNANVYKAYDDGRLSTVMLKVSNECEGSELGGGGYTRATEAGCLSSSAMLRREYELLAMLAARGCACAPKPYALRTVYAPARTDVHERTCLEMQRLEGVSLADVLAERKRPLNEFQATYLACEIMHAGAQVQRCGVLHRDIHPGNVILGAEGVYLIDFGTACTVGDAKRGDSLCLTSGYEPPEAHVGGAWIMASDVYAIARTVIYARWRQFFSTPDEIPDTNLGRWLARCVQPDPEMRFSSCAQAASCLEKALSRHFLLRWACSPMLRRAMEWHLVANHCGIA